MALVSIAQPSAIASGGFRARRASRAVAARANAVPLGGGGPKKLAAIAGGSAPALSLRARGADASRAARPRSVITRAAKSNPVAAAADAADGAAPGGSSTVTQDIIAGISTACVAMPQSCAYALLAGTGVKCAVMAAAASSIPCAILGSSRYLQVGCLSLGALLTRGALVNLGLPLASETYVMGAACLAFYSGVTRLACGLLKLGNIMTSLPVPLLQGFVSAATWMVFFSQVPAMVGATAQGPLAGHFATAFFWLVSHPATWHIGNAALAAATFVIMLNGSKIHKLFPSALVCCVLGCLLAFNGIDIGACVGAITVDVSTLWPPAALSIPGELAKALLVPGVAMGVITYLEGAAVCRFWADNDGEKWDSNKELIAQGVANICSGMAGGMNVAGVISRSSFGITAGAKTRLAHFVTGVCLILFVVTGGGALLAYLPKAVLGALVGCGVLPLLGPTPIMKPLFNNFAAQPWKVKRDCIIAWVTVAFTFTARPTLDIGLYRGAAFACAIFLLEKVYAKAQKAQEESDAAGR